jgi:hypothetical protein
LGRVVGGVLEVLVERRRPGGLLRPGVDLHRAGEVADGGQQLARHVGDWPVRGERDAVRSTVGVLSDRVMGSQVEHNDQRAGAVGRRQRQGLPSASAEAQSGVLELRLWRGERRCELAEDLSMRVQRVAGGAPRFVGKRRPSRGHPSHASDEDVSSLGEGGGGTDRQSPAHGCSNDGASSTGKAMSSR